MTPKEKLIFELDKMLNEIWRGSDFIDYVFICSKSYECKITEYKGIKIFYHNWVQEDFIFYMQNPYFKFENV